MPITLFLAAAPVCDTPAAPLPASLSAWTQARPAQDMIMPGNAAALTLKPSAGFAYAVTPPKPDEAGRFSGVVALHIHKAGQYAVALSLPAWIDMIRDGKSVASTAHQHGPDCSGIRKIVVFDLVPGEYRLQLNNSPAASATVLVTPWP